MDLAAWVADHDARAWPRELLAFSQACVCPGGAPFSLEGRDYLHALYRDPADEIVVMKAAQMGATTWTFCFALHQAVQGRHGAYFLDTKDRLADMVQSVFHPTLEHSPELRDRLLHPEDLFHRMQRDKRPVDNVRLLRVGAANLYFRSMQRLGDAKSIPLHFALIDEGSEVARAWDPDLGASLIDFIPDRLMATGSGRLVQVSQPGLPGLDIHQSFLESDGKEWLHTCACGREQDLVETFPECLQGDKVVCACGRTLYEWDPERERKVWRGKARRWVAARPGAHVSGYHLTQLYGPTTAPAKLKRDWERAQGNPSRERRYSISVLGLPAGGDRQPLQHADIEACVADVPVLDRSEELTFAGVDTGEPHWFAAGRREGDRIRLFDFGPVEDPRALIGRLRALSAAVVIDAQPERTLSREIVAACRAGALCEFAAVDETRTREHEYLFEDRRRVVQVLKAEREDSLDEVVACVRGGRLMIPRRHPHLPTLRAHLLNLVRDPSGRRGEPKYRAGVENHLALSLAYLLLAIREAPSLGIASAPLAEQIRVGGSRPQEW